jgi:uncharacterized membrane protein YgaE (UPF0421/DUF939 family)
MKIDRIELVLFFTGTACFLLVAGVYVLCHQPQLGDLTSLGNVMDFVLGLGVGLIVSFFLLSEFREDKEAPPQ